MIQRCRAQGIGFESLIFEYSGALESEGDRLLISFAELLTIICSERLDLLVRY